MTTPHRARALLTADDPARHFDTAHVDATELRAIPTTHPVNGHSKVPGFGQVEVPTLCGVDH